MGFWSKLGKIGLTVAPYVAAPFTGGASLALTGAANQAVGKWNQHDANEAAKKGLAPSNFDRYLGMAGNVAGMAGGMGAFGKTGSTFSGQNFTGTNPKLSGWQNTLSKVGSAASRVGGGYGGGGSMVPGQINNGGFEQGPMGLPPGTFDYGMPRFNQQARRMLGPVMGNMNQNNPNLAESIGAGRMEAIRNQPWRGGYDTQVLGDDDQIITQRMPTISPFQRRQQQFSYTPPESANAPVEDYGEAPEEVMGVEERRKRGLA